MLARRLRHGGSGGWDGEGGLGDRVILAHGGGWTTTYGQLSQITAVTGETVEQGEVIGYVGATGGPPAPTCTWSWRRTASPRTRRPPIRAWSCL